MIDKLLEKLAGFEQVEAIALGGSRSGENYDEKSDYDVYVYITAPIDEESRRALLADYCKYTEIGNHYWEYEDNCVLNNGIDIDILYRDLDAFSDGVARVVEEFEPSNGYTTCTEVVTFLDKCCNLWTTEQSLKLTLCRRITLLNLSSAALQRFGIVCLG